MTRFPRDQNYPSTAYYSSPAAIAAATASASARFNRNKQIALTSVTTDAHSSSVSPAIKGDSRHHHNNRNKNQNSSNSGHGTSSVTLTVDTSVDRHCNYYASSDTNEPNSSSNSINMHTLPPHHSIEVSFIDSLSLLTSPAEQEEKEKEESFAFTVPSGGKPLSQHREKERAYDEKEEKNKIHGPAKQEEEEEEYRVMREENTTRDHSSYPFPVVKRTDREEAVDIEEEKKIKGQAYEIHEARSCDQVEDEDKEKKKMNATTFSQLTEKKRQIKLAERCKRVDKNRGRSNNVALTLPGDDSGKVPMTRVDEETETQSEQGEQEELKSRDTGEPIDRKNNVCMTCHSGNIDGHQSQEKQQQQQQQQQQVTSPLPKCTREARKVNCLRNSCLSSSSSSYSSSSPSSLFHASNEKGETSQENVYLISNKRPERSSCLCPTHDADYTRSTERVRENDFVASSVHSIPSSDSKLSAIFVSSPSAPVTASCSDRPIMRQLTVGQLYQQDAVVGDAEREKVGQDEEKEKRSSNSSCCSVEEYHYDSTRDTLINIASTNHEGHTCDFAHSMRLTIIHNSSPASDSSPETETSGQCIAHTASFNPV